MTESFINEHDQSRIWEALQTMPYGGGLSPRTSELVTVDTLLDTLASLAARLRGIASSHDATLEELRGLRKDLRAVGRVFGYLNEAGRCIHENAVGRCQRPARPGYPDCELHRLD
jgi:hypothetical protein